MIARLYQNYCLLLQFDKDENMLYLSRFPYVDGSYHTPTVLKSKFDSKMLTTNDALYRHLSLTQTVTMLQGLEAEAESSKLGEFENVFAFLAIDETDLVLRVVFCGHNETFFRCQTLHSKVLIQSGQENFQGYGRVKSLQVQDDKILVILPSIIFQFNLADVKNLTTYGYTRSMKFVQYFNHKWYGVSTGEVLFVLEHDASANNDLMDISFYRTAHNHRYADLVATDSYLVARYHDEDEKAGVSIYYYTEDDFFTKAEQIELTIPDSKNGRSSITLDKVTKVSEDRKITSLDFEYTYAKSLAHYYEWNGNLLMFGVNGALMMSLPPSIHAPPGKKLMYQTLGTFNQTYIFEGSVLIHLLPVNNDTNRCASITSKMLGKKAPGDSAILDSHLFINNVESSSPVLSFEKLTDDELQQLSTAKIDLYFKKCKDTYLKRSYTIRFDYYKPGNWLLLWVALACIVVLFLAILGLCIAKCWKAIGKGNNYSIVEHGASNQKYTDEPFLNDLIPERLAPLKSRWD